MAGDVTVRLSQGYEAHGRTFTTLTLRPPKMADFEAVGEIYEYQPAPGGTAMIVYHDDRVWAYRDRLLVKGPDLPSAGDLADLTLVDAIAIKEAITGFFTRARPKPAGEPPKS